MTRFKPLGEHLGAAPDAARVIRHAHLLTGLGQQYNRLAPANLARASRVANFKSGIVIIHADHGAVAAKLRQLAGRLTHGFVLAGWECNGIEVRVQDRAWAPKPQAASVRPLTANALASIRAVIADLPEPSPMRAAVERLVERAARSGATSDPGDN